MLATLRPIDASMSKLTLKRAVLLAVTVLLCKASFAQSISNTFTLFFDKTTAPLIDLTGEFSPTNQTIISSVGESVPLSFGGLIITNMGTGKIKGVSVVPILAQIGDAEPFAAQYKVNGSVTGGGTKPTRVDLTVVLSGVDQAVVGVNSQIKVVIHYKLTLDAENWVLSGTSKGSVRVSNVSSGKINTEVSIPVPGSPDGAWSVNMNVLALKNIGGSATVITPTGRPLTGTLSGNVNKDGLARVHFKGTFDGRGSNVRFNFFPGESGVELQTMKGKLLGQTVLQ